VTVKRRSRKRARDIEYVIAVASERILLIKTVFVICILDLTFLYFPWPESASELYRPSDRRKSTKIVPTFADRGMFRNQRVGTPTAVFSVF
jgi:hypothetical protein